MTNEQLMTLMLSIVCGCCIGYMVGNLVTCIMWLVSDIKEKRRKKKELKEHTDAQ